MLLYLDTSALVKLYVDEAWSDFVVGLHQQAEIIASHQIVFVEFHAALARRNREGDIATEQFVALKKTFTEDWANYLRVQTEQPLLESAAELAEAFSLRACDSVHLAAARLLEQNSDQAVMFACFDKRLNLAAKMLGMQFIPFD